MKKRFTEEQIIGFLREAEAGMAIKDLCRRHGFSAASYYLYLGYTYKFCPDQRAGRSGGLTRHRHPADLSAKASRWPSGSST